MRGLGELVFIGLGLHDEKGLSLRGLEQAKTSDQLFVEFYTNVLPNFSLEEFEKMVEKRVYVVSRNDLEESDGEKILEAAEIGKVAFLVPGDPFVATTHIALRVEAEKRGISTRVIHGPSIISAIISLSGLHNYKFGKTVTIPFPDNRSETPYEVITQNKNLGLHTLCLLDIRTEEGHYLTIRKSLELLLEIEKKRKGSIVTPNTIAVGASRVGSQTPVLKAGLVKQLLNYDFGMPPHSLLFPGTLHFMEAEALIVFGGAPEELRGMIK